MSIEDHQAKLQVLYDLAIAAKDYYQAFQITKEMYWSSANERNIINQTNDCEREK